MAIDREKLLKIIVGIHFMWANFVFLANWLPTSYLVTQMTIIVLGIWAIVNREHVIQIELLMVVKGVSILFDVVALGMYYVDGEASYIYSRKHSYFRLSAGFAIFLLILKPIMLFFLNTIRKERAGNTDSPTFGGWGLDFGGQRVPGYQPVGDNPAAPSNAQDSQYPPKQQQQDALYPQNYQAAQYP